jgi:hypothetical protein
VMKMEDININALISHHSYHIYGHCTAAHRVRSEEVSFSL